MLPPSEALVPYLQRIDTARIYSNFGPLEQELTGRIAKLLRLGFGSVLACSSGTMALTAAATAARHRWGRKGDLCLCPSYTFVATAGAIQASKFQCHLVDIDTESWSLDAADLRFHPRLNEAGLIMPVVPYGRTIPLETWQTFQDKTHIPVVIDGAASLDQLLAGNITLPASVPIVISLHATKSVSSGEGGLILCRDEAIIARAKQAINHGFAGSRIAQLPGLNGKMSEYHAAIGLAELDRLPAKVAQWDAVAAHYRDGVAGRATPLRGRFWTAPDISDCYVLYEAASPQDACDVQQSLDQLGIDTRFWYGTGIDGHSGYSDVSRDALPHALDLGTRLLGLPCFPGLKSPVIRKIVAHLK
jgi:dTDP-4-amino-4,6-dideoxygalactose transaminase